LVLTEYELSNSKVLKLGMFLYINTAHMYCLFFETSFVLTCWPNKHYTYAFTVKLGKNVKQKYSPTK